MKEVILLCSFGKPSSNSSNKHDGSLSKRIRLQCRRHRRCRFDPWVGKIPWRRKWQPTPVFLPEESMDRGAWWVSVHRIAQSWTQLKQFSMHAYTTGSEITHRILARTQIPLVITYTHTCNPLVQNHLEQCRPLLKFSLERESVTSHN